MIERSDDTIKALDVIGDTLYAASKELSDGLPDGESPSWGYDAKLVEDITQAIYAWHSRHGHPIDLAKLPSFTKPPPCQHLGGRYGDHEYFTSFCSDCNAHVCVRCGKTPEHHTHVFCGLECKRLWKLENAPASGQTKTIKAADLG